MKPESSGNSYPWINPIGGLGDMLMLSGVLKLVSEQDADRRFNLIRRTRYQTFLEGHPAIAGIGHPPAETETIGVDYWALESLGPGNQRPFQVLARRFGLETPVPETIYVPGEARCNDLLMDFIPWGDLNVMIAPASDSPRKTMDPPLWHELVDLLRGDGAFVMQGGRLNDIHIRNTYSVLGLTSPREFLGLLKRCDLLITSDNFMMHAAHYLGIKAVVLWGATNHEVYGYPEHVHLQMPKSCDLTTGEDCVAPPHNDGGRKYGTPCPEGVHHCMNRVPPPAIHEAAKLALGGGSGLFAPDGRLAL